MSAMQHCTPTGRTRHRSQRRLFGREELVLQLEYRGLHTYCIGGMIDSDWLLFWRDASSADVLTVEHSDPTEIVK